MGFFYIALAFTLDRTALCSLYLIVTVSGKTKKEKKNDCI